MSALLRNSAIMNKSDPPNRLGSLFCAARLVSRQLFPNFKHIFLIQVDEGLRVPKEDGKWLHKMQECCFWYVYGAPLNRLQYKHYSNLLVISRGI